MPKSAASQPLFLYSTTVSDVGTVRANNQDSSFAGEHLIAMCDGMGGHAGGDTASSIAIRSLAHIEQDDTGGNVETISRMMETSVMAAHDAIVARPSANASLPAWAPPLPQWHWWPATGSSPISAIRALPAARRTPEPHHVRPQLRAAPHQHRSYHPVRSQEPPAAQRRDARAWRL